MTSWKDIVKSMHPFTSKRKWLTVLQAYFDESGHESDCHVMAFAAITAPLNNWERFELKWKRRLRRAGIDTETHSFHAADFFGRYKPFDTYKWEDGFFRSSFHSDLITIIDQTVSYVTIRALVVKDWQTVIGPILTPYEKRKASYVFLMTTCLGDIYLREKDNNCQEKVACIFDRKPELEHYARSSFYKLKDMEPITNLFEGADWKDKRLFVPLQAADLLAYEGYQSALSLEVMKTGQARESFRRLFCSLERTNRISIEWYTEDRLQQWMQGNFD